MIDWMTNDFVSTGLNATYAGLCELLKIIGDHFSTVFQDVMFISPFSPSGKRAKRSF